jgi:hypothetical protein
VLQAVGDDRLDAWEGGQPDAVGGGAQRDHDPARRQLPDQSGPLDGVQVHTKGRRRDLDRDDVDADVIAGAVALQNPPDTYRLPVLAGQVTLAMRHQTALLHLAQGAAGG